MKSSCYNLLFGTTAACTKILMEETNGLGQRYFKGSTRGRFLFDSWLSSNKSEEAVSSIGVAMVGVVKTNTKGFSRLRYRG